MPGAMHRGRFDDWYPGFVDHVNNFRNTVSFLTETALYRYATPHFYTVEDFPRDKQDLHTEVFYSSPVARRLVAAGGCGALQHRRLPCRCWTPPPRIARSCSTAATARART